jgi:GNAT superfamily N-acetyltransferase
LASYCGIGTEARGGTVEDLEMVFEPLPGEALTRFLRDNIINVNIAKTGVSTWHPVGYFLKNARGEWLGGLTGYVWGGWFHVGFLWVTELLRGQGHGSRLMDAAEALALQRGALAANFETHSFRAEDFYLRQPGATSNRPDYRWLNVADYDREVGRSPA